MTELSPQDVFENMVLSEVIADKKAA